MGKKLKQKAAKFTPPRNKQAARFFDTPNTTGTNTPKPHFSLRDELSSTAHHRAEWTPQSRLRDHKISFISAGTIEPLDEPKVHNPVRDNTITVPDVHGDTDLDGPEDAMAQMDINAQSSFLEAQLDGANDMDMEIEETTHLHAKVEVAQEEPSTHQAPAQSPPPPEDPPAFFIDTAGDDSLAFKGPKVAHTRRAPSPARSDSSDEVVLFRGRAGVTVRDDPPVQLPKPAAKPSSKPATKFAPRSTSKPAPQPQSRTDPRVAKLLASLDDPPEWAQSLHTPPKPADIEPSLSSSTHQWPSVDQALGFSDRLDQDLSNVHASRKGKKNRKKQNRIMRLEKDLEDELMRDYIANIDAEDMPTKLDFDLGGDDSASTDGVFEELLNEEEQDPEDDGAEGEWYDDDSDSEDGEEVDSDDDDEDSSDLEERLDREEREAWEDDADIRERRAQAMSDEELARLFAKQQELGIDDEDIVLYDDGFGDVGAAKQGLANYAVKGPAPKRGKKKGRKSDSFPDASLMADVLEQDPYGGFDVMDYERPSIRQKPKGRKSAGPLPEELGISDDDLIEELKNQWSNDRNKKASKKAEREELRQLGMLGKKNKFKPDLNQRYDEGLTMSQIRTELEDFLDDDRTTQAFPPMLKEDRKILHEIANHFNLKSKSVGNGKNRAPVLIKTSRTVEWNEHHFERVKNIVGRSFLKNSSKKTKTTFAGDLRRVRKAGGAQTAAGSYRNGDVVGHNAAEIPQDNFGRKLMEKMGWSSGMSLGKEGNTGLLVPVQATVKSGKAGLG